MSGIMSMVLGARTAIAAAVDEFFNRVTLLLPGNGTNGAQNNTFLDSSSNNFTITRNGNTTQGTFSPFSQTGWSNYFNGTTDYLTAPSNAAYAFGTGDFTIEAWIYLTATPSGQVVIGSTYQNSTTGVSFVVNTNVLKVLLTGDTGTLTGATTVTPNAWHHVAVTRSGTSLKLFIDGVQDASTTNSSNIGTSTSAFYIGRFPTASIDYLTGYVSNLRVLKGTAQYTSSYTVPTAPLTAITNTQLLTCQSNRFIDNSSNAFAITVNGTPSVQAFSPFAPQYQYTPTVTGGSGYFDGTGDYLTAADNAALDVSSGDFTVECWFYANGVTAEQPIVSRNNGSISTGSNIQYNIFVLSGSARVRPYSGTTDYTINVGTVVPNAWNHIALVRTGNTFYGYLNGTRSATTQTITGSLNTGTWSTYIGGALISGGGNLFFNGYCGGVRVTKGGALYTGATYTVPTSPFTTTVSAGTANLLINFTNAGITDATAKNVLETVGNAQISTTQSKFGGSSMYFDGTGDYITFPASQNFNLTTGNFTIECWFYYSATPPSGSDYDYLWGIGANNTNGLGLYIQGGVPKIWNGSLILTTTGSISATTWYHLAVVRSSGTLTVYLNGTSIGSVSMTSDLSGGASVGFNIARWVNAADVNEFTGYIDDLRITKGYARYTANFSVPTAAFALQ